MTIHNPGCSECERRVGRGSTDSVGHVQQQEATLDASANNNGQLQKHGRKGHKKSRDGCYNCKKAKIKCKGGHPMCTYCSNRGLSCVWPSGNNLEAETRNLKIRPTFSMASLPQLTEPSFTAQDFRLFFHFIRAAYPMHPIGNDSVWTHEIPSIAAKHDFLLHAMLALAASDIARNTGDDDLQLVGLSHRFQAIRAFNRAVSFGLQSAEQGNAMIAGCFALISQSIPMNDCVVEYLVFLRGVTTIAMQMGEQNMGFMFAKMAADEHLEAMEPTLRSASLLEASDVAAACTSLASIASLCTIPIEAVLHNELLSLAQHLFTSPRDAYINTRNYLQHITMMPDIQFKHIIDRSNQAVQLLQAHFIALQIIMVPITVTEAMLRRKLVKRQEGLDHGKSGTWISALCQSASVEMKAYYAWPLAVEAQHLNVCEPPTWQLKM